MLRLSHIGEILISKLITKSSGSMKVVCGQDFASGDSIHVVPDLRLNPCGSLSFDGLHKVDISVINLNDGTCYPIEAKLGFDRLGKSEFEKRFLSGCGTSHNTTRVKGSMISILERHLPNLCSGHPLTVMYQNRDFIVSGSWSLICRESIIKKWSTTGRPNLSSRCKIVSFESIAIAFGGKEKFNNLVSDLISMDYFTTWVKNA